MGEFATKFLIDGIDRLGKSSLIKGILDELGYHLVIHYDKPLVLKNDLHLAKELKLSGPDSGIGDFFIPNLGLSDQNLARLIYQDDANRTMFNLLATDTRLIFDRTHLGELVYAPLYRGYKGDYVYQMEETLIESKPYTVQKDVRLILLISSNTDMLVDDGLSFDPTKKAEEQQRFIDAFNKSKLPNKVMIDVHNGNGGYRPYADILKEALYKK
jgi:hypothetical protein